MPNDYLVCQDCSWCFRMAVPPDLRGLVGKTELRYALNKAPIDRVVERGSETPITDEVEAMYDPSKERIKEANYSLDLQISKLKGCL